jgi:hypothetical protein
MAKPKVFMIVISRQSALTDVQKRGIGAVLGNTKFSFTAWPGGCVVATQWQESADDLFAKIKNAIGTNDTNIGAFQLGSGISSLGTAAFGDSVAKLKWLLR